MWVICVAIHWSSVFADWVSCRPFTPWGAGCAISMPAGVEVLLEVNERLVGEVIEHTAR